MKRNISVLLMMICYCCFSQENNNNSYQLEGSYFYGNIYNHNSDISHLINGHPTGAFLSFNKKTFGLKDWEKKYNFPDWGLSFIYKDLKNETLGENYGLYANYNFYLFKRNLQLSLGSGLALNTNPYDQDSNYLNIAYGTSLLSSSFIKANFIKNSIWKGLGFQAGLMFIHYSNGNTKAPNTSTNSFLINAGLNYQLNYKNINEYVREQDLTNYGEKIKFNFVFRTGWNQSDVIGSGTYPFYVFSAFVDKKLNYYSTLQFGADLFISKFLEEFIRYTAIAYPESNLSGDEDYKRVSLFVGHELSIDKNGILFQIGYYVYYPYEFEKRIYLRAGFKRYFYKNKLFAVVSLKSHWAQAEAVEFGVGYRF